MHLPSHYREAYLTAGASSARQNPGAWSDNDRARGTARQVGASSRWKLIVREPEMLKRSDEILKIGWSGRLSQISISTQLIGGHDIRFQRGGSQDDDNWRGLEMPANPFEDFQPHHVRQFQVQKHEGREWELLAVGEFANALQIVNRLLAVAGDLNGVGEAYFLHGVLEKEHIIGIVFDLENCLHV